MNKNTKTLIGVVVALVAVVGIVFAVRAISDSHKRNERAVAMHADAEVQAILGNSYKSLKIYSASNDGQFPVSPEAVIRVLNQDQAGSGMVRIVTGTPGENEIGVCSASAERVVLIGNSESGKSFVSTNDANSGLDITQATGCPSK